MRGAAMRSGWRDIAGSARQGLARRDLLLIAGGLTFYATLAGVPVALVVVRAAAAVAGQDQVLRLGNDLAGAVPSQLGAPALILELVDRGVGLSGWPFVVALFPASLYGEGLRRALVELTGASDRFTGWRGRLQLLPLLAVAPALLLVMLSVTPRLNRLFGQGGWAIWLGVVIAFSVDWLVTTVPIVWVFRVVSPDPPTWTAALVGGTLTASFVAGFLQGFVLFLSLPLDLGAPFAGLTGVGALCALELWAWLLHLVVLCGYVVTRAAG